MTELKLFVKGWTTPITPDELKKRFIGVKGIEHVKHVEVNKFKNFGHVLVISSLSEELVLQSLKTTYKNAKWKGGLLSFEKSLPNFEERFEQQKRMRITNENKEAESKKPNIIHFDEKLKIRKQKGSRFKSKKKARLVYFTEDNECNEHLVSQINEVPTNLLIPLSQDPAYCCSKGDAGPTKDSGSKKSLVKEENLVSEHSEEAPSLLFKFIKENYRPKLVKRKNSPNSILGLWYKLNPNEV